MKTKKIKGKGQKIAPFLVSILWTKSVDKSKISPHIVYNLWMMGSYPVSFPQYQQGYPHGVSNIYVNKGGRNGL